MRLVIELPSREDQMVFNRSRWVELLSDPVLARLPYRLETNAHGQIVMNPPPSGRHSFRQGEITHHLRRLLGGRALPECPLSTIDGIKAIDVGWFSDSKFDLVRGQDAFEDAPEICVEVISPSNTQSEMRQKKELYFEAGASEVWFCQTDGKMEFYNAELPSEGIPKSRICPEFPVSI